MTTKLGTVFPKRATRNPAIQAGCITPTRARHAIARTLPRWAREPRSPCAASGAPQRRQSRLTPCTCECEHGHTTTPHHITSRLRNQRATPCDGNGNVSNKTLRHPANHKQRCVCRSPRARAQAHEAIDRRAAAHVRERPSGHPSRRRVAAAARRRGDLRRGRVQVTLESHAPAQHHTTAERAYRHRGQHATPRQRTAPPRRRTLNVRRNRTRHAPHGTADKLTSACYTAAPAPRSNSGTCDHVIT